MLANHNDDIHNNSSSLPGYTNIVETTAYGSGLLLAVTNEIAIILANVQQQLLIVL